MDRGKLPKLPQTKYRHLAMYVPDHFVFWIHTLHTHSSQRRNERCID